MNLKQKCRKISAALAANLLVLFTMVLSMRPSFETNDDIVFAELGSGLRGVKDAHLVFQNYGLGVIYRFLYAVTGRLPWYTICSVCDSSGGIYCSDLCINEQAGRNFRPVSFSDPCMWIWL